MTWTASGDGEPAGTEPAGTEPTRTQPTVARAEPTRAMDPTSSRQTSNPAGRPLLTPAVGASVLVLCLAAATSVAWVVGNGGVVLPARSPGGGVAGAVVAPTSSRAPTPAAPSASPVGFGPAPTQPTGPVGAASPTPPSPVPPRTAEPTGPLPGPLPSPTSDRYAVLVPCPETPDCYRYTVRRGDNLWSIARWFGVPLESVYERNPELRTTTLRPGTEILLPRPTR